MVASALCSFKTSSSSAWKTEGRSTCSRRLGQNLSTLPSINPRYRRSHLYTLNDTFIVNFSSPESTFLAITEQGVEKLRLMKLFFDGRKMCKGLPYTGIQIAISVLLYWLFSWIFIGSASARFGTFNGESTLIDHKGRRTVVLRFLKVIRPVKCLIPFSDGCTSCPKEGEHYVL